MSEKITPISIEEKMKDAYLNYSLSVIVSRALPDVRDGLKPVHRRILYGCYQLGLTSDKPHKKSARLVGEVLGKFHPHGDNALYKTLVRMAQPFTQRYRLIDGHGNFGSIDGDNAAAMRYTEARLTELAEEMLHDLENNTVGFSENFDGTLQEPDVLPTAFPNLLINGSSGIAVGMSTDIPPHNLNEVIEGVKALMMDSEIEHKDLRNYIPGPDFPTGGKIIGIDKIEEAYYSGNGSIINRGTLHLEREGNDKKIIITEIPYQISKAKLVEEITEEVKKDRLGKITRVRDESDQEGMRIVLKLKYDAEFKIVENRLYKFTSLQKRQRINMLALVNDQPEVMNLKEILSHFIEFRRKVVKNRINHKLKKEQNELEILRGLNTALDKLDKIIDLIRNSSSKQEASNSLQKHLKINENQAEAILSMQLHRLVKIERKNVQEQLKETEAKIENYQELLASNKKLDNLIIKELDEIKEKYGDERRTQIIKDREKAEIEKQDLIKNKTAVISISIKGKLKRSENEKNIRAAKNDYIIKTMKLNSLDNLIFFTESGYCYNLPVHEITEHHGLATGDPLTKYLETAPEEQILASVALNKYVRKNYIAICTLKGRVKITKGEEYKTTVSKIKAVKLEKNDFVKDVFTVNKEEDILIVSKQGRIIRFSADEITPSRRNTMGNWGIKLEEGDFLQTGLPLNSQENLVALTPQGRLGRLKTKALEKQNRYGKGKFLMSKKYQVKDAILCTDNSTLIIRDKENELNLIKSEELPGFKQLPINRTRFPFSSLATPVIDISVKSELKTDNNSG